jgi:hypothetical protein
MQRKLSRRLVSVGLLALVASVLVACANDCCSQRASLARSQVLALELCFSETLEVEGAESTQSCFPVSVRYESP